MIRVSGVSKCFRDRPVLRDVGFEVPDAKVVVILGPSGIGKTVLLRVMSGLTAPDEGTVEYDGVPVRHGAFADNRGVLSRLGYVFQGGGLFDSMTVAENVALPLVENQGLKGSELEARVESLLARVGMEGRGGMMPGSLSGGMTRLVAIARALACDPKYLLFDEPTTALDPVMRGRMLDMIAGLRDRDGKTEVVVTHDLDAARQVADITYMLKHGRLSVLDRAGKESYETSNA